MARIRGYESISPNLRLALDYAGAPTSQALSTTETACTKESRPFVMAAFSLWSTAPFPADFRDRTSITKRGACGLHRSRRILCVPQCQSKASTMEVSMRTPKQGQRRSSDHSGKKGSNGSHPNSESRPMRDAKTAKVRLLKVLSSLINLDSQHGKVEQLVLELESLNAKPVTAMFTEMALAGEWKLVFSSMTTKTDGSIRIRKIGQKIDPEKKKLINEVLWSFPSVDDTGNIDAYLWAECDYKFVAAGRLQIETPSHSVKIVETEDGKKQTLPDDMQKVITTLRSALPIDFFEPQGLLDVSYIEPNFRLGRFVGKRLAGVRNVFVRDGTDG